MELFLLPQNDSPLLLSKGTAGQQAAVYSDVSSGPGDYDESTLTVTSARNEGTKLSKQ